MPIKYWHFFQVTSSIHVTSNRRKKKTSQIGRENQHKCLGSLVHVQSQQWQQRSGRQLSRFINASYSVNVRDRARAPHSLARSNLSVVVAITRHLLTVKDRWNRRARDSRLPLTFRHDMKFKIRRKFASDTDPVILQCPRGICRTAGGFLLFRAERLR